METVEPTSEFDDCTTISVTIDSAIDADLLRELITGNLSALSPDDNIGHWCMIG